MEMPLVFKASSTYRQASRLPAALDLPRGRESSTRGHCSWFSSSDKQGQADSKPLMVCPGSVHVPSGDCGEAG